MLNPFINAIFSYLKVIPSIKEYKLFKYFLISAIISLVFYLLLAYTFFKSSSYFSEWIVDFYPFEWGKTILQKLANVISFTGLLVGLSLIYKYVVLIILAPIMSLVSESIEKHKHPGTEYKMAMVNTLKGMLRGARLAFRNIFKELFYTLVLLIIGWIFPVALIVTTPLIFIIQAYYVGAGNIDYYMERHTNVSGSVRFTRQNKFLAVGNGCIFLGLLLIPIIGAILAPFFGAVAASLETDKLVYSN